MPRRKTQYFPDYGANLPYAGPDWIWARANSLLDAGRYATIQRDGPLVVRAAKLIRAMRRGFSARNDRLVQKNDSDLVEAENFRGCSPSAVLEMHMRVLAGQGPLTIAAHMGMRASIVHTYGSFFFDVAGRLGQRNFVIQRVIGIHPELATTPEQMAMMAAFDHGAEAIDPWLDWYANWFEEHDLTTSVGRLRETIDLRYQSVAIAEQPSTGKSVSKILPILAKLRHEMFLGRYANDLFRENLAKMNREVRFGSTKQWSSKSEGIALSRNSEPERDDRANFNASFSKTLADRPSKRRHFQFLTPESNRS